MNASGYKNEFYLFVAGPVYVPPDHEAPSLAQSSSLTLRYTLLNASFFSSIKNAEFNKRLVPSGTPDYVLLVEIDQFIQAFIGRGWVPVQVQLGLICVHWHLGHGWIRLKTRYCVTCYWNIWNFSSDFINSSIFRIDGFSMNANL